MGTFVAVYVRGSGAAAWLMRVPLGGTWVAFRHGWLACRVWLNCNLNAPKENGTDGDAAAEAKPEPMDVD